MSPHDTLRTWAFDPGVIILLAVAAALYARGSQRMPSRSVVVAVWFWSGWAIVALALLSPLDTAGEATLTAHMVQHLLIGAIAPLLLVAGRPLRTMQRGLPPSLAGGARVWSRRLRRLNPRRHPVIAAVVAVALHVGGFWLWHLPRLYDAAIAHDSLHALEHTTFLLGGIALWSVVGQARWHHRTGGAVLVLFAAAVGSGALAALLTLAPRPLYGAHLDTTAAWHLTPLEDQQLAGAVMWVPGGLVYTLAAAIIFVRWLESGPESKSAATVGRAQGAMP
jgi:cytochrome c oxidase assembly factor CtaG